MNRSLRKIIIVLAVIKIVQLAIPFFSFDLFTFQDQPIYHSDNFVYPFNDPITWKTSFKTWDSNYYIYLAEQGYKARGPGNQMPPLFPFLIRGFWKIIGHSLTASLFLSNLFSFFALIGLYKFTRLRYDDSIAFKTVLYALLFPTSFFFSRVYSESLFLFLAVFLFYSLSKRQYKKAALCAFALPLTRTIGLLIFLPIVANLFFDKNGAGKSQEKNRDVLKKIMVCLAPLFGLAFSMIFFEKTTGNWLELFQAHQTNVSQHSVANIFDLKSWFYGNFIHVDWHWYGTTNNIFDRVAFVVFLILLFRIWIEQNITMFVYALAFGMVPALSDHFMSYTRFLIVIFPIYTQMALNFRYHKIMLFLMLVCQIILLSFHSLGYWVA